MSTAFDETKHPRFAKGHPRAGQFMPKPDTETATAVADTSSESDPSTSISEQEREDLLMYQKHGYAVVNTYLRRSDHSLTPEQQEMARTIRDTLDKLIAHQPEREVEVWRGGSPLAEIFLQDADIRGTVTIEDFEKNPQRIQDLEKRITEHVRGKIFRDNGFVSTSMSPSVSKSFLGFSLNMVQIEPPSIFVKNLVRIRGKTRALPIAQYTRFLDHEQELVLPRGTAFRIRSVSVQKESQYNMFLLWDVEIVKE